MLTATQSESAAVNSVGDIDLDVLLAQEDDDKTFAALGIAKTINTVIFSVDSSPEILSQVQETIVPILLFTFESRLIGMFLQLPLIFFFLL